MLTNCRLGEVLKVESDFSEKVRYSLDSLKEEMGSPLAVQSE